MSINERIDLLAIALGVRKNQLIEGLSIDGKNLFSGEIKDAAHVETFIRYISKRYGVNDEWLRNGNGQIFCKGELNNGKKSLVSSYAVIEDGFHYRGDEKALMKSLKVLDAVMEGEALSVKEALEILEDARAILLEYMII